MPAQQDQLNRHAILPLRIASAALIIFVCLVPQVATAAQQADEQGLNQVTTLNLHDKIAPEQVRLSKALTKRDIALADQMERDRLHAEHVSSHVPARQLTKPPRRHPTKKAAASAPIERYTMAYRVRNKRHFRALVPKNTPAADSSRVPRD